MPRQPDDKRRLKIGALLVAMAAAALMLALRDRPVAAPASVVAAVPFIAGDVAVGIAPPPSSGSDIPLGGDAIITPAPEVLPPAAVPEAPSPASESADSEMTEVEDDPYAYNEAIAAPAEPTGVEWTQEAPPTAADELSDEHDDDSANEPAAGPVTVASGPPLQQPSAAPLNPRKPVAVSAYQGPCTAASTPEAPAQWRDLSVDERGRFPLPRAVASVYAAEPPRRFIVIDDAVFREGSRLPDGSTLLHIDRASLVLAAAGCAVEVPLRLLQR